MNYNFKVAHRELNEGEATILNNFFIKLLNKPNSKLIYRGESILNLKSKLNIQTHEDIIDKLNHYIFKIGEKGRVYQKEFYEKLKDKSIFSIDETSETFFKYIFRKINKVLQEAQAAEIENFKYLNTEMVAYFLNKENLKNFVSTISELNDDEKLNARDYYLNFLHRVGKLGFYNNTFMLSTSSKIEIAEQFSTDQDIIFVSWQVRKPVPFKCTGKGYSLPTYKTPVFAYQKEITLKGGLFPQDILGFIERSTNFFYVNPNLFFYPELIDYMIKNGIPIDQTDFAEVLSTTNYSGSFHRDSSTLSDTINNNLSN